MSTRDHIIEEMLKAIREIAYALDDCHDISDKRKKDIWNSLDSISNLIEISSTDWDN